MPGIFYHPRLKGPERQRMLDSFASRYPNVIGSREMADAYLTSIFMPHSKQWAFCRNGKAGTSSTINYLFELEFGSKLTVDLQIPGDINPNVAAHELARADVFRPVSMMSKGWDTTTNALRLATVRHPATRALSAFFYLCTSHDQAHPWFARDRLRMNALVGFDWQRDPHNPAGFAKFLRYIEQSIDMAGVDSINAHWRPQLNNIKPKILQPHLIGRTENLGHFFREIARQLGHSLPDDWLAPVANKGVNQADQQHMYTQESNALIERIYRQDFQIFAYPKDRFLTVSPLAPTPTTQTDVIFTSHAS